MASLGLTLGLSLNRLPALSEGDERISLGDILTQRDAPLADLELWAVCVECCVAIQRISHSPEVFQTVCISPDTLAFDSTGAVCFLEAGTEPGPMYIPPEYETVGNSAKSHLYSLGMTMSYAAEYNVSPSLHHRQINPALNLMLTEMTKDEYDERASLDDVISECAFNLKGATPSKICQHLVAEAKMDTSAEESEHSYISSPRRTSEPANLRRMHTPPMKHTHQSESPSKTSPLSSPSPTKMARGSNPRRSSPLPIQSQQLSLTDAAEGTALTPKEITNELEETGEMDNFDQTLETEFEETLLENALLAPAEHVEQNHRKGNLECNNNEDITKELNISRVGRTDCSEMHTVETIAAQTLPSFRKDCDITQDNDNNNNTTNQPGIESRICNSPLDTGTVTQTSLTLTSRASPIAESEPNRDHHGLHRLKRFSHRRIGGAVKPANVNRQRSELDTVTGSWDKDSHEERTTVSFASVFGRCATTNATVGDDPPVLPSETSNLTPPDLASDSSKGLLHPPSSFGNKQDFRNIENESADPDASSGWGSPTGKECSHSCVSADDGGMERKGKSRRGVKRHPSSSVQGQCIQDVLHKLGCGLHENELWALCRECVLALQDRQSDLPAYVSLDTVTIQDSGQVTFRPVPEDKELELVYLAPELQQHGVITEKTCLFGLAAMLWSAADYKLPSNQEPVLSDHFETLLISMMQDSSERRPSAHSVLQACNSIQKRSDAKSTQICRGLASDARKAAEFGRENKLVRDILDEEIHHQAKCHKAQLVNSIGVARLQSQLKPVGDREMNACKTVKPNLHEQLCSEIKASQPRLRKSSGSSPVSIQQMYQQNPELMKALKRVTVKATKVHSSPTELSNVKLNQTGSNSAFTSVKNDTNCSAQPVVSKSSKPSKSLSAAPQAQLQMPPAYQSTATHFTPIILTGESKQLKADVGAQKTPPQQQAQVLKKPTKPKVLSAEDRERQTMQKIKELKKNLIKNRLPLTLAQDLEKDILEDVETEAQSSVVPPGGFKEMTPPNLVSSPKEQASCDCTPFATDQTVEQPSQGQVLRSQSQGHVGDLGGLPQVDFQGNEDQMPSVQKYQTNVQSERPSHVQGHTPNMGQGHIGQGHIIQGHVPMMQQPTQLPSFSYPVMQAAPMFPFQVQFQQDPRTGLFQIIPVAVPPVLGQPVVSPIYGSQIDASSTHSSTPSHFEAHNISVSSNGSRSPTYRSQESDFTDRVRYTKHPRTDPSSKSRSQKYRSRMDSIDKPESEIKYRSRSGERLEVKVASRSGRQQRSRTLGSLDIENDLAQLAQNGKAASNYEDFPKLMRPSSEELWDKIEQASKPSSRTPRTVKLKDLKSKLKRAKSGSSIDYQRNSQSELRAYPIYDDTGPAAPLKPKSKSSNPLSRSQPNLDSALSEFNPERKESKRTVQTQRKTEAVSLDYLPSPPPSPSLSKDSGLGSWNRTGDPALLEKLLNSETIRHQQKLSKIIKLVRDEFAFDGYMENGIEDFAIAEYILSLGSLTYGTFSSAVTEKYCDLFWAKDLLISLFEAVNGFKPKHQTKPSRNEEESVSSEQDSSVNVPPPAIRGRSSPVVETYSDEELENLPQTQHDPSSTEQSAPILRDCYDQSAFRPIKMPVTSSFAIVSNESKPMYKPRPIKPADSLESSSDSGSSSDEEEHRQRHRNRTKDHARSSSLHNIVYEPSFLDSKLTKARSQGSLHCDSPQNTQTLQQSGNVVRDTDGVIYVKSLGSDNDLDLDLELQGSNRSLCNQRDPFSLETHRLSELDRHKSKSSYHIFRPSAESTTDSKKTPSYVQSQSSHAAQGENTSHRQPIASARLEKLAAKSESHLLQPVANSSQGRTPGSGVPLRVLQRGFVVYYSAEMELIMHPDVRQFALRVDAKRRSTLESKMADLDQQLMMEYKNKKKTQRYYRKLVAATKSGKVSTEHKAQLAQYSRQLQETKSTLDFLDAAKKHLEMLHAEHFNVSSTLLYSLSTLPSNQPLCLSPSDRNPLLQHQAVKNSRGETESELLQAGTPVGLMSYLYAERALSNGFIHQFFYCYRYFLAPCDLLQFLRDKYTAACLMKVKGQGSKTKVTTPADLDLVLKVKTRTLDLLQVWLEGYYTFDFKHNQELRRDVQRFLKEQVAATDSNSAEVLLELMDLCTEKGRSDLYYSEYVALSKGRQVQSDAAPLKKTLYISDGEADSDNEPGLLEATFATKKWESFKAALHLSAKPIKLQQQEVTARSKFRSNQEPINESQAPIGGVRSDLFTLTDYSATSLAEQLTLMEQELFRQSHPLHFLNSKVQGVGVGLAMPIMSKSQSIATLNSAWDGNQTSNLFVGHHMVDDIIERLIEHAQSIAFWVAAEILSCNSTKGQVAVLSRFIQTAKSCQELRNYASCMAVLDGLENVIVRQLPAWKTLPSKSASAMDELVALKVLLSTDSQCLLNDQSRGHQATIPCHLLLLLQVQQLEIGGFTLANGMFKWSKMRAITKVVDQLRIFHQYSYRLTVEPNLQALIRQRIQDLGQQDLTSLAAQHDGNFRKVSSGNKLQGAFRRMKVKLQGRNPES